MYIVIQRRDRGGVLWQDVEKFARTDILVDAANSLHGLRRSHTSSVEFRAVCGEEDSTSPIEITDQLLEMLKEVRTASEVDLVYRVNEAGGTGEVEYRSKHRSQMPRMMWALLDTDPAKSYSGIKVTLDCVEKHGCGQWYPGDVVCSFDFSNEVRGLLEWAESYKEDCLALLEDRVEEAEEKLQETEEGSRELLHLLMHVASGRASDEEKRSAQLAVLEHGPVHEHEVARAVLSYPSR